MIYAASPLFFNVVTDEPLPEIAAGPTNNQSLQEPQTVASGQFAGVNDGIHNAQGQAKIVRLVDGKQLLRFEDFRATNGPDLHVSLATNTSAKDYADLGKLKANIGNQNYDIQGVDLAKYRTAWFGASNSPYCLALLR